jgi:hypothetical protein
MQVGGAGPDVVDGLAEQGLGGVTEVAGRAWVGELRGDGSQDADVRIDGADSASAGLADDALAREAQADLAAAEAADVPDGGSVG